MSLLGGKQPDTKQVGVVTRNPQFKKLLASILAEWKFFSVDDLADARVVFVERGLELPPQVGGVVWLTPMPPAEGNFLVPPISLSHLYHLLEGQFFSTPRRHIRVAVDLAIDLEIDGTWLEGRLLSLSVRGGRIACAHEMPRGRSMHLQVTLDGRVQRLVAEAIYSLPAGDAQVNSQPQVGVLFKSCSDQQCEMLRQFIEKTCIVRACTREGIALHDPCLSWLDVPTESWTVKL
jgi:hypothetical protein